MPWASGSVSNGTSGSSSTNVLGQPWVRISGMPRPCLARSWTKWMRTPSRFGAELIGRVQFALLCVPIEPVGPIGKQLSQVLEVSSLLPGSAW